MAAPAKQPQTGRTAAQRWAAVWFGLWVACAAVAPAQTNVPVAAASPAGVAPATATQTNAVSQTPAAPPATNTVSLVESIQADSAFQSYTNLLEHSLFVPASDIGSSGAGDPGLSFAGSLRVTGFWKQNGVIEASIEDRNEPDKKMFVKMGDMVGDTEIKVVGFDLRGRAVLLKKGDEEGRLEYESEAMAAPTTGKPGVPGMPAAPGQPGMAAQRPGMPPTPPQPGMPPGSRTGGFPSRTSPQAVTAGGSGESNRQVSRREQREQTITRLRQMMQSTADPAAKQRLQNYIQMLEKANTQE